MLKLKVKRSDKKIVCSLIFDEMAIRERLEWDGNQYHGLISFGSQINDPNIGIVKEIFVFMLVAINESWKIPIGYFFINGMKAVERSELVKQCINIVLDCGIVLLSVTFDGLSANFSMLPLLGCNIEIDNLLTKTDTSIYVFPDPSHMVKLIRNTFGDMKYYWMKIIIKSNIIF